VLSIRSELRDNFWERLALENDLLSVSVRQRSDEYVPFSENSLIRVMTAHGAKGAEFRAVHLLGAEEYRSNRRELAFTAVTRAKTELDLYHVSPLPGHMMPPTNTLPDINKLF
jgi:superfamily I DNA/RNA helicase